MFSGPYFPPDFPAPYVANTFLAKVQQVSSTNLLFCNHTQISGAATENIITKRSGIIIINLGSLILARLSTLPTYNVP